MQIFNNIYSGHRPRFFLIIIIYKSNLEIAIISATGLKSLNLLKDIPVLRV